MMDTIGVWALKGRGRRVWPEAVKREICAAARSPGVSVSEVARRFDVNANLVFTWLRDPRFGDAAPPSPEASFLPLALVDGEPCREARAVNEGRIEIDLSSGHKLRITGDYDPEALARLIRGLPA